MLWRIADLIQKNIEELAELETLNNGKPIFESRYVDMPMVADVFRYDAGWATKIHGETVNTFAMRSPTHCAILPAWWARLWLGTSVAVWRVRTWGPHWPAATV